MVHFVNMPVENGPMKDPVTVVKQSLSSDRTKNQANDKFPEMKEDGFQIGRP
jgi:hypothetical protein